MDSKTQTKYRDKLKLSEHSSIVSEYGGTHHSWENPKKKSLKKVYKNDKFVSWHEISQSLDYDDTSIFFVSLRINCSLSFGVYIRLSKTSINFYHHDL